MRRKVPENFTPEGDSVPLSSYGFLSEAAQRRVSAFAKALQQGTSKIVMRQMADTLDEGLLPRRAAGKSIVSNFRFGWSCFRPQENSLEQCNGARTELGVLRFR